MPGWVIEVASFTAMYPGMTPDAVLSMGLDAYDWLPVATEALTRAGEMRQKGKDHGSQFRRHGPGG